MYRNNRILFHWRVFVTDGLFLAINDEHITTAVSKHDHRPPLDAISGPDDLMSSLKSWIARCWHKSPDERPSFDG